MACGNSGKMFTSIPSVVLWSELLFTIVLVHNKQEAQLKTLDSSLSDQWF